MKKVALVHDWLNGMRGGEKVLEIICDLFPYSPIYTLFYEPDLVSDKLNSRKIIPSTLQQFLFTRDYYRHFLPLYPWAIERFDFSEYNLILSTSHCAAKGVRVPKDAIHVCYCLTPMRYIWDRFGDYFGRMSRLSPVRLAMTSVRKRLQKWDVKTSERVDFFIACSKYVADRIKRYYGRDSEIIHPPVDTEFFHPVTIAEQRARHETVVADYYLISTALVPYKRVDIAIEAFRDRPERLLVVGSGPEEKKLQSSAPPNVTLLGWISDQELLWLYQNCRAFIFTSEEDFGIAPLEAMSCGRPVIAYGYGGARETVVEGKTGIFFYDQSPASLEHALDRFNDDDFEMEDLREHARQFSDQVFFNKMKDFLKEKVGL
jgi:glycosyltransferase involved in cell wall biosynthesis